MERDGLIAHGLSGFLEESLMVRGDEYYMAVCNTTGSIAIYNQSRNVFLSPFADGPIQFKDGLDDSLNLENVSRFGKTFSIVRVPYALKLLMQELQTMNIQMRIITEDNVDQLTNMSSNKELRLQLGLDEKTEAKKMGIVAKNLMSQPKPYERGMTPQGEQEYGGYEQQQRGYEGDGYGYGQDDDYVPPQMPYYGDEPEQQQFAQPEQAQNPAPPMFVPGGVLGQQGQNPSAVMGGGELEEVDIEPMEQTQPQQEVAQPVAQPATGQPTNHATSQPTNQPTVFNQTIVLPAQPQPQQSQLTPDAPVEEEADEEDADGAKVAGIMNTITDAKEATDASLTVDTEPAPPPVQPVSLLHSIVDDIKPDDAGDNDASANSGAKTISILG